MGSRERLPALTFRAPADPTCGSVAFDALALKPRDCSADACRWALPPLGGVHAVCGGVSTHASLGARAHLSLVSLHGLQKRFNTCLENAEIVFPCLVILVVYIPAVLSGNWTAATWKWVEPAPRSPVSPQLRLLWSPDSVHLSSVRRRRLHFGPCPSRWQALNPSLPGRASHEARTSAVSGKQPDHGDPVLHGAT